jgi:septal ring factor EnvC (AmiA/AmiB activator)
VSNIYTSDIQKQISQTQKEYDQQMKSEKKLYLQLDNVAKDITTKQQKLGQIKEDIKVLDVQIAQESKNEKALRSELKSLENQSQTLQDSKKTLESKMVEVIAKDFSLAIVLSMQESLNKEAIITNESLDALSKVLNKEFYELKNEYKKMVELMSTHDQKITKISKNIQKLDQKKEELSKLKIEQDNAIARLTKIKTRYLDEIKRVQDEQRSLNVTLKKLNIIKEEEDKKAQELAKQEQQKAQQEVEQRAATIDDEAEKVKVRQIGSSYQKTKVVRYRGQKTIPPLESFKVVRNFGPYVDPVYNIKIFNESLIMSSSQRNSKVRNVLNGKVIFAQSTALLKNVVIVEHANSLHTIYAGLTQIAPTIERGKKIKKGYTVGRIDDELVFQVTKKSYYINPKDLITLN